MASCLPVFSLPGPHSGPLSAPVALDLRAHSALQVLTMMSFFKRLLGGATLETSSKNKSIELVISFRARFQKYRARPGGDFLSRASRLEHELNTEKANFLACRRQHCAAMHSLRHRGRRTLPQSPEKMPAACCWKIALSASIAIETGCCAIDGIISEAAHPCGPKRGLCGVDVDTCTAAPLASCGATLLNSWKSATASSGLMVCSDSFSFRPDQTLGGTTDNTGVSRAL